MPVVVVEDRGRSDEEKEGFQHGHPCPGHDEGAAHLAYLAQHCSAVKRFLRKKEPGDLNPARQEPVQEEAQLSNHNLYCTH